ncbi:hypothetical protein Gotur_013459 [Gossypium turneri]
MRNTNDPDFLNYLNQENSYAQAFMADTGSLQRTLVAEMKNRMPSKVSTPVECFGPWFVFSDMPHFIVLAKLYYEYIPEGKEYPVLCRRLQTNKPGWAEKILSYVKAEFRREEILLDWNEVAEKHGYVHVGQCRISPDHNFLAYTLDATGSEQFMLQIKDLRNGCIIPMAPVNGVVSLAWAQDCKTLLYTIADENQRPYRHISSLVLCTKLEPGNTDDTLVFMENDPSYCVDLTSTKDGKFITVYVVDATEPLNGLQRVHERVSGLDVELETSSQPPGRFVLFVSGEVDTRFLFDMDIFNGHLVLFLNKDGFPMICSIDLPINVDCKHQMLIEDLNPWFFPIPSNSCSIEPGSNLDFMSSVYRVVLSSPVIPDVIVDYDMARRTFSIVQQEEVLGAPSNARSRSSGYELDTLQEHGIEKDAKDKNVELERWKDFSSTYCCERKEVISHDGIRVPLTILYSPKAWKSSQSPGILHGYGAYGEVLDKSWRVDRLSLLDRGWVIAFADVRGGGGDDPSWHKTGNGLLKQNSIHDFVSCGKYLIDEGYVQRDQLSAIGVSAGCLLIGAALNMYPNLFHAAILKVPFLDILNSLLDPSLPLTMLDYEEFGNPGIKSEFECISSYCPYKNIRSRGCHPSVLVTASFNDSRVGVWEAAKWVAKVRDSACSSCSRSVILTTNMSGGHFGEGGRYIQCEELAYDYAFLVKAMGVDMN